MSFDPYQIKPPEPAKHAWEVNFSILQTAIRFCAAYFASRPRRQFVISLHVPTRKWYVYPTAQIPSFDTTDPRFSAVEMFRGNYELLRDLAIAFPPELFPLHPIEPDVPA